MCDLDLPQYSEEKKLLQARRVIYGLKTISLISHLCDRTLLSHIHEGVCVLLTASSLRHLPDQGWVGGLPSHFDVRDPPPNIQGGDRQVEVSLSLPGDWNATPYPHQRMCDLDLPQSSEEKKLMSSAKGDLWIEDDKR